MTNILNNLNNNSLLDNNLMSYGLLLGSLTILGYSIYYFSDYLTKNTVDTHTLPDTQTMTQRIVENIEYQNLGSSNVENIVPKLDSLLHKVDTDVQSDGTNLVESAVQTDQAILYDYLKELLYNNCTPTTFLAEISTSDFIRDYKNDPSLASYFNKTAEWADSITRQSSGTSANSEVLFLRKVNEDIRSITELIQNNLSSDIVNSNISSPVSQIPSNLTPQFNIEKLRADKLNNKLR